MGMAASMGSFLLAAGAKGKRFSLPNSMVLIHQPLVEGLSGQATDIEIHAKELLRIKKRLNEILAERTGKSLAQIEKDVDRDYIMTAEDAKAYGLIDAIITERK
jgi:ATP-dependent Clp protease protease subunit